MNKNIFWFLVLVICLGFGIWGLGFWLGGCASTEKLTEAIATTTSSSTTASSSSTPTTSSSTSTNSAVTPTTTTVTIITLPYGDKWGQLGSLVATGTDGSVDLKISKGGDIYVAYTDQAGNNQAMVKKYSGSSWVPVGGAVSTEKIYFSLSIAGDGTPYIGYSSGYPYGHCTLKKYDGSSWITVANADVNADGLIYLLAADDGTPYLAYSDKVDGYKAKVLKYSGGNWTNLGGNASADGGVGGLRFFIYGNVPYLAYQDSTLHGYLGTVRKYENGSWQTVGSAGFTSNIPDPIQLFVSDNIPYFAYPGTVMSYESSSNSWTTIATNEVGNLFVDNGTPYLAYVDNNANLILKKYSNGTWVEVPPGGTITSQVARCSLAIFNGIPYIAYSRAESSNNYPFNDYYIGTAVYTGP